MKKGLLLRCLLCFCLILNASCASNSKNDARFRHQLTSGDCDSALKELPDRDPRFQFAKQAEQAGGKILSYSATGASYTAEVLWDVVGGTVMFVALCSPAILATAALSVSGSGNIPIMQQSPTSTGSSNPVGGLCLSGKISALGAPALGRKTYHATQKLRCPELMPLSRSIREVAGCYVNKKDKDSLVKARENLNALQASADFFQCLPVNEQTLVNQLSTDINNQLLAM